MTPSVCRFVRRSVMKLCTYNIPFPCSLTFSTNNFYISWIRIGSNLNALCASLSAAPDESYVRTQVFTPIYQSHKSWQASLSSFVNTNIQFSVGGGGQLIVCIVSKSLQFLFVTFCNCTSEIQSLRI